MKARLSILTLLFALLATNAFAQSQELPIDTLNKELYSGSTRYTEADVTYRVIRWNKLNAYFKEIKALDQVKTQQIKDYETTIAKLEEESANQAASYDALNQKFQETMDTKNSIKMGGIHIKKQKYNLMMWTLVLALTGIGVALFLMFKRSNQVTKNAKKELLELQEEYESYRKRALKREQEVASSYQREINKLRGVV